MADIDSDATLDPDDSDNFIGPSDDENNGRFNLNQKPSKSSPVSLKKRLSLPYKFKKTNSSVHSISDSDSDHEPVKTSPLLKSPQLKKSHPAMKQESGPSSLALTVPIDSDSDDDPMRIFDLKSSISKKKSKQVSSEPVLSQNFSKTQESDKSPVRLSAKKQSSANSLHHMSNSDSDEESVKISISKLAKSKPGVSPVKRDSSYSSASSKPEAGSSLFSRHKRELCVKSSSPVPQSSKRQRDGSDVPSTGGSDSKPSCPYGAKCYRKNPEHRKEFRHPGDKEDSPPPKKKPKVDVPKLTITQKYKNGRYFNFFLTSVEGIDREYNSVLSMGIKDILSSEMGSLEASAQFNYMTDIPWLVQQYPAEFRSKPLLIVHGEQRQGKAAIERTASKFSHIKLCQAKLEIMYGTHHTKMMFLLYKEGMRVVIHTSNLIQQDWHQKTQGIWISPLFPKLSTPGDKGESLTMFKHDLLQYIGAYRSSQLTEWESHIREHDMSNAKVYIIGSVPGRHVRETKSRYGHLKLRWVLQRKGPQSRDVHQWPVVGQFSSVGSMGANKENWLCSEWLQSLSAAQGDSTGLGLPKLQLIYPSKDNVRLSLEGYPAGGSLPYSIKTAQKQTFLHKFFHVWKSEVRGRSRASPHIKTYSRISPSGKEMVWFLVTSANLSKAAWGALEKGGTQLMIRSYELGVLFLPDHYGEKTFKIMKDLNEYSTGSNTFPVPYDLPPQPYTEKDVPWIWDIQYKDLPDTNGNAWCPP